MHQFTLSLYSKPIRMVPVILAVTYRLHFWQNDRDLLRATAVTQGWNGYRNKSQHRKLTLEKRFLPQLLRGLEPGPFEHESGALTTELSSSPPPPPHTPPKKNVPQRGEHAVTYGRCCSRSPWPLGSCPACGK